MNTTRSLSLFLALALLGLVFLVLSAPTARADAPVIVRVTVNGATSGTCGDTWPTACGLQYALTNTVATPGTELWVAAGTYTPTAGTDRTATFRLRDNIALYGGFAMTETLRSQRNFTTNVSILSGDINGNDNNNVQYNEPTRAENAYHVVTGSGVTNTAVLDGFTVTGANADDTYYPGGSGGGMYNLNGSPTLTNITFISNTAEYGSGIYNDNSAPTLTDVTFAGNAASNGGGGMANWNYSRPTLTYVTFISNSAPYGGGMNNDYWASPTLSNTTFISNLGTYHGGGMFNTNGSSPMVTNATFSDNLVPYDGGGMYNYSSSPMLTNVTFGNNIANLGGGMFNIGSSPTLTNVTFLSNTASTSGGGMVNDYYSSPTLTNVTFSGNAANSNGGGMYNEWSSSPTIRNGIVWSNAPSGSQIFNDDDYPISAPSLYDSVVQGGCPAASDTCTHIITADPRLGSLGNYGGSTQTVPLLPSSSAINAGNDAICAPTDQRGKPRLGVCDIGAFEFQGYKLTKTGGDQQSTRVNTSFGSSLQVQLNEIDTGLLPPGVVLTFTAPSSGASAAWSGSLVVTATTNASGMATVSPPTANGIAGSYAVTTTTAGANPPVTFSLTNVKSDTTTAVNSSANPSSSGQSVTFTAVVSGASASGSVVFKDGGAILPGCGNVVLRNDTAQCTVSSLAGGSHAITAAYSGDANDNASTSAVYTQTVSLLHDYLPLIRR